MVDIRQKSVSAFQGVSRRFNETVIEAFHISPFSPPPHYRG